MTYTDHPHPLMTAPDALRFILAGNAYFTIRSRKTQTRFTYRVNRADCRECGEGECTCGRPANYFVSLLAGPDNSTDYVYIGMLRNGAFTLTKASKMHWDSDPIRALRWSLKQLQAHVIPPMLEIWHEGRCGRCGRRLTVPESVALGIGPDCASKMGLQLVMFGQPQRSAA